MIFDIFFVKKSAYRFAYLSRTADPAGIVYLNDLHFQAASQKN